MTPRSSPSSEDDLLWFVECGRALDGAGEDSEDLDCELPEGHVGRCGSRSAVDHRKLTDAEYCEACDA